MLNSYRVLLPTQIGAKSTAFAVAAGQNDAQKLRTRDISLRGYSSQPQGRRRVLKIKYKGVHSLLVVSTY